MSQLSNVTYSRNQWKHKAKQRGDRERYRRKQDARNTAERNRITQALEASQARQRQLEAQRGQLEAQLQEQITQPKVEVVLITLQLFEAAHRISRRLARPESPGLGAGNQESAVSTNGHQLGDAACDRSHPIGPPSQGLAPEPGPL